MRRVVAIVGLAAVIAGCGKSESPEDQEASVQPATEDTATATAAGLAIAFGGALRDAITTLATNGMFGETLEPVTTGYSFVYHTEIGLLFFTLMILGPLVRTGRNARQTTKEGAARIGLADFPT